MELTSHHHLPGEEPKLAESLVMPFVYQGSAIWNKGDVDKVSPPYPEKQNEADR